MHEVMGRVGVFLVLSIDLDNQAGELTWLIERARPGGVPFSVPHAAGETCVIDVRTGDPAIKLAHLPFLPD